MLAADELMRPRTEFTTILDHLDKYERGKARRSDQSKVCFFIHDEGVAKMYDIDVVGPCLGLAFETGAAGRTWRCWPGGRWTVWRRQRGES